MASGGVSGLAVTLATGGGLLLWSGLRNVTPADTLRTVLGQSNEQKPISTPFGSVESGLSTYTPSGGDVDGGNDSSTAAGNASAATLLARCRSQIGKPYKWAATGPNSFDCSGLIYWALKGAGYPNVPRFTTATFGHWAKNNGWTRINDPSKFQAGDVVLKTGHMGVCSGPGRMVNAPRTGTFVREEALWKPIGQWWGWRMGRGILTAPTGKRVGVPTTPAQELAELRRIG